ncbi:MAG: sulfotransferase [Bacteroidales bacterium]|nr:sulfotransferase [Bacteroidales bacterium]
MQLLLVTYISRSGSTLFLNQLSKYEKFCVCPEADMLVKEFLYYPLKTFKASALRKKLANVTANDPKLRAWNITEKEADLISLKRTGLEIFITFLQVYRNRVNPKASTIVFKAVEMANCYSSFESLDENEYSVKHLAILRDPRGIFNSQSITKTPLKNKYFNTNPLVTAYLFNHMLRSMTAYEKDNPNSVLTLRFEDFLENPKNTILNICTKLGVGFGQISENDNSTLFARLPVEQKQIHKNVIKPIIGAKVDEWKTDLSKRAIDLISHEIIDTVRLYYPDIEKPRIGLMTKLMLYYYKARIFFSIDKY